MSRVEYLTGTIRLGSGSMQRRKERYIIVDENDVPIEKRIMALKALKFAANELGVVPELTWFVDALNEDVYEAAQVAHKVGRTLGQAGGHQEPFESNPIYGEMRMRDQTRVWINADTPIDRIAYLVGHEVRHVWQAREGYLDGPDTERKREVAERDATTYGRVVAKFS